MSRSAKDIRQCLEGKLGFVESEHKSDDHYWYELHLSGLPVITTKVSRGSKAHCDDSLEAKVAKQLHVRKSFYNRVMSCELNRQQYYDEVSTNPYPPFPNKTR